MFNGTVELGHRCIILSCFHPLLVQAIAFLRAFSKTQPSFIETEKMHDEAVAAGVHLSDNMVKQFLERKIASLLDGNQVEKAMQTVYALRVESAEANEALLQESLVAIARLVFPTKTSPGFDLKEARAAASAWAERIEMEKLRNGHTKEELECVRALLLGTDDPKLYAYAVAKATEAQRTFEGRRVQKSVLSQFALSKVGKLVLKHAGTVIEAQAKDAVNLGQMQDANKAIQEFTFDDQINEKTIQDLRSQIFILVAGARKSSGAPSSAAECGLTVSQSLQACCMAVLRKWATLLPSEDGGDDGANAGLADTLTANCMPLLQCMGSLCEEWYTKMVHDLQHEEQPSGANYTRFDVVISGMKLAIKFLPGQAVYQAGLAPDQQAQAAIGQCKLALQILQNWDNKVEGVTGWLDEPTKAAVVKAFKWLHGVVTKGRDSIGKYLDQTFSIKSCDSVQFCYDSMSTSWDISGKCNMSNADLSAMLQLDQAKEIKTMDLLYGACTILAELSDGCKDEWLSRLSKVQSIARALPAFLTACVCQSSLMETSAATGTLTNEQLQKFSENFKVFNRECTALANTGMCQQVSTTTQAFRRLCLSYLYDIAVATVESCKAHANRIKQIASIDLEGILKAFDSRVQELVDINDRSELLDKLKKINGEDGLRKFDLVIGALQGSEHVGVDGKTFGDWRDSLVKVRQLGRLVVTSRSAALTITRKKANEVKQLKMEAKTLKVTLPKVLMNKLNELEKSAEVAADDM